MMSERDNELVRSIVAARAGDGEAFRHVFSRFAKPILSFIFSLTGDQGRAEELTQETFIRSYRKLGSLRNADHVSTWLFGIARNVVREAVREKYRQSRTITLEDADAASISDRRLTPQGEVEADELSRRIREALAALPADHRLVFVLKVLHEMPYDEIATITGASVGKLKTDLHRARAEMRRRLGLYLGKRAGTTRGDEL